MTIIEKAALVVIVGFISFFIVATIKNESGHADYVVAHKCKELSREPRAPIPIYQRTGNISYPLFIKQPDKVTYSCDNGPYVH